MPDIIHLLPDATANMIAAGEVVQRPASIVKELMENSLDAGSSNVQLVVQDGGQTLIQVVDNGKGMTETDARMCWERHATSKIAKADDLFHLNTFGFRGEAMASIAAVSQVDLKTRMTQDEVGTYIHIEASEVKIQEPVQCAVGTSITVKNLFFNIPARRNFLKSVSVETRHIIEEFQRIALAYPSVAFTLINNGNELFKLERTDLKSRIAEVLEIGDKSELIPLNEHTNFVAINGFAGSPKRAKRTRGDQYFFVNGRYIRDAYFNHAVMGAYDGLLDKDQFPTYVVFFEIEPTRIDVNVHPSKTEVKFEDSRDIYAVLKSVVRKSLGSFNLIPDNQEDEGAFNPMQSHINLKNDSFWPKEPQIKIDPNFNPFGNTTKKRELTQWEKLYDPIDANFQHKQFEMEPVVPVQPKKEPLFPNGFKYLQLNNAYIVLEIKAELYIVNQQYAHERVLYEKYKQSMVYKNMPSQQLLFPRNVQFNTADTEVMLEIIEEINRLGFDISHFGKNDFIINGVPPDLQKLDIQVVLEQLLDNYKMDQKQMKLEKRETLIRTMARHSANPMGRQLTETEVTGLIEDLFHSNEPAYTPFGKPVFVKFANQKIENLFNT
jgi:DNA mismatch repair protein MutL